MTRRALATFLVLALLASVLRAADDSPVFIVKNDVIPSPATAGAFAPQLVNAPDGTVYLSWLEPAHDRHTALRFARFDTTTHTWSPARTIGESLTENTPANLASQLAVSSINTLVALWHPAATLATFTTSNDGGANWSPPLVLNRSAHLATAAVLQPLPDGQFLAAWIEPDAATATLLARTADAKNPTVSGPVVVDPSVSPECAPALTVFPDGSALVAYRGLTPDGVHDIRTARFHDGHWDAPVILSEDNWKPATAPHNSPVLVSRGIHTAAAWFTATDGARVNVSVSDNAGAQWLMANRVDDIAPLGRPSLLLFDDGSQLVSWVEKTKDSQVALLRRISARGNLSVPVQIGPVADHTTPSLARVKDGDATPAQILVATQNPPPSSPTPTSDSPTLSSQLSALSFITTSLLTLPSVADLSEADPCGCDPRPEDLRGYPIQGRVLSIDAAHYTLQLEHGAIVGVMPAGTTTVQAGPEVLRAVQAGNAILARLERDGPAWSLFAVRVLASPPLPAP